MICGQFGFRLVLVQDWIFNAAYVSPWLTYEPGIQTVPALVATVTTNPIIIVNMTIMIIFSHGATAPSAPGPPHYRGFTIALRHATLGRTPLYE